MIGDSASSAPGGLEARSLGGFVLRELVGAGGFGDVYLAEQAGLRREAVVKVLRAEERTDERIQRFLREAQLASRLDHPYAAHIYAFGAEPDGTLWIAMELVRGSSLRAVLEAQGPMAIERFVPFFERICEVVHTAHEQDIIHRDLKPDNIMVISRAGRLLPKLLDFGIARAGADPTSSPAIDIGELDRPAEVTTQRGSVLGSPPYMAPELWVDAHGAVAASDQYALGALAYEMLTGNRAFVGRSMLDVARAHSKGKLPPLGDGFPVGLDAVLKRSLARSPGDRYASVLELAQALRDASGVGTTTVEIPQLDEELRVLYLTAGPQPLAEAVAAYDSARNVYQAREALRTLVRIAAWYVGVLALASRTRVGSGGISDSDHARSLLRDLRRQGLTPRAWVELARQLTAPFVRLPDTYPLPELVLLLHPAAGVDPLSSALDGSLSEALPDASEEAASQSIVRELPTAVGTLRALRFLCDYRLVAPRDDTAVSWMGTRVGARATVPLSRPLVADRLVIVDAAGGPLLALWPLFQLHEPMPGHPAQMFMLAGPDRQGARLLSPGQGFEHRDDELWDWFRDQLFDDADPGAQTAAGDSPYRGLSSYGNGDAQWFFGRERETEALVNRLKIEPFVAVVGPSGVGKSSFIHAGVVPALVGWHVVTTRPGRSPLANLSGQLTAVGLELELNERAAGVIAAQIKQWASEHGGLLIVVDQFEELFTLTPGRDERERFVNILLAVTRTVQVPVRVVVTLRDDFLIRAEQLPGFDQTLARGLQLLGPLGPTALERILIEPAHRAGYQFEDPALPARMVAEIVEAPAAVALLSFTASRLWDLRDRHFRQLPRKAYEALGGVGGALARHADTTVDAMPPAERSLARKAFRHLVTFEGTRAVLGREELEQLIGGADDARRLIERLLTARLISSSEGEHGAVVEIVHEALLGAWPRLVEWRREDLEGSRFHEHLRAAAKQWHDRGRPRGLLWRGDALAEYVLWRRRQAASLTPVEAAFGAASAAEATRGRRLRRALLAAAALSVTVFIIMLWRANAAEQASRRESDRLLRDSTYEQGRLLTLAGDELGALARLVRAYAMGETGSPIRMLIEAARQTTRAQRLVFTDHDGIVFAVALADDRTTVVTGGGEGTTRIWNIDTGIELAELHDRQKVLAVAVSPGSKLVVAGGKDKIVRRWDVATRRELPPLALGATVQQLLFSPDGTRLVGLGVAGNVRVWDVASGVVVGDLAGHHGGVMGQFCASGACLGTWDDTGVVTVWDAHTLAQRVRYERHASLGNGAISRDGSLVVVGTAAGALDFLRPDGVVENKLAHDSGIVDIQLSPDGITLATTSADMTAKLWDVGTGKLRVALVGHHANVMAARFSPDGTIVATSSADNTTRLWNVATGAELGELVGHTGSVSDAAFTADGKRLVTASWDHRAIVWDVVAAQQYQVIETAAVDITNSAPRIAYSHDGHAIAMITADGSLAILDGESAAVRCRATIGQPLEQAVWSGDGTLVAAMTESSEVAHVWTAACAPRAQVVHAKLSAIAFAADNRLVTAGGDLRVRVWRLDGSPATELEPYPDEIDGLWFKPGTNELYVAAGKRAVVAQDLDRGGRRAYDVVSSTTAVAFDTKRHRVLASSYDHYIWVWDADSGELLKKLECSGPLFGLSISPDGNTIVGIGGLDPNVWDADTLQRRGSLPGHHNLVVAGHFVDDRIYITAASDGEARVWDASRLEPLFVYHGAESVVVSPDTTRAILADDRSSRLLRLDRPAPPAGLR